MQYARIYRNYNSKKEYKYNVTIKESDLFIISDKYLKKEAYSILLKYRIQIENFIKTCPEFLKSLTPIEFKNNKPEIINEMLIASKKANVGPFASVAGAISQFVCKDLKKLCNEVIIENGGDIYIDTQNERLVQIYSNHFDNIGIKIKKEMQPIAICSSSAKIGHSLSFGKADLVVVIGKNAPICDAFATSICNKIRNENNLQNVLNNVKEKSIYGIIAISNNKIAIKGKIEFVKIKN